MNKAKALFSFVFITMLGLFFIHAQLPDEHLSEMVIKPRNIKEFKAKLDKVKALKGIKKVKIAKDKVHIYYDKKELGCCKKIHQHLQGMNIDYSVISNKEYPSCKGEHHEKNGKSCSQKGGKKACCKHKKS